MFKFFSKNKQNLGNQNSFSAYLILTIVFTLLPYFGNAQQNATSENENSKPITAAKEIMQNANTCALITIDDEGRPRVRTMDSFPPEENLTVWFGTNIN